MLGGRVLLLHVGPILHAQRGLVKQGALRVVGGRPVSTPFLAGAIGRE